MRHRYDYPTEEEEKDETMKFLFVSIRHGNRGARIEIVRLSSTKTLSLTGTTRRTASDMIVILDPFLSSFTRVHENQRGFGRNTIDVY